MTTAGISLEPARTTTQSAVRRFLPAALVLVLIAVMATWNLEYYPRTWLDEGINLSAARDYAFSDGGSGSLQGSLTVREFTSIGPTVLLPVALSIRNFGAGLVQARAVTAVYLVLAAMALLLVAAQLYGLQVGVLSALVFASIAEAGPFLFGRHVLGELPALAFLLLGISAFVEARKRNALAMDVVAGTLFGLAILTKNQFLLVLPAVGAVWLLSRWTCRPLSVLSMLAIALFSLLPQAIWYATQLALLGPERFGVWMRYLSDLGSAAAPAPFARLGSSVALIVSINGIALLVSGLLYLLVYELRKPTIVKPERLLIPAVVCLWLAFFLVLSPNWMRYAVPGLLLCSVPAGKLAGDLLRRFTAVEQAQVGQGPVRQILSRSLSDPIGLALVSLIGLIILAGIGQNLHSIVRARDDSPQQFASFLVSAVEPDAVVETYEWEIDFLSQRVFHHPPPHTMIEVMAAEKRGGAGQLISTYRPDTRAGYLVNGPFTRLVGLYDEELSTGRWALVGTRGEYVLYRAVR